MRALGTAAKKQDTLHKACAAVGVPVPAALPADGGQCFELQSVHGVLDCDFPHLGGKALEKAPPDDPKELRFLVYGTFAATEDDFENDRGCKDMAHAQGGQVQGAVRQPGRRGPQHFAQIRA